MKDETISYLKKAAEHAISYDKRPQEYTYKSTFLKGYHDQRENVVTDSPISQSYNLLTKISDQRYDFIRNDQEFVAIINKLKGLKKDGIKPVFSEQSLSLRLTYKDIA